MMSGTSYLEAFMNRIEHACNSIQMHVNPAAAEAAILSLSQSPRPYQACIFILKNSHLANARFQAAGAIRDAALREWVFLTADEKKELILFCLSFVMQNASSLERYLQAKVSAVAAQLLKRGWLEFMPAVRENILLQVKDAIYNRNHLDFQYLGLNFLESLVSEFSPSSSTALGLREELNEQCQCLLDQRSLENFYCWAQDAAFSAANKIMSSASTTLEADVCAVALQLMLQILKIYSAKVKSDVYSAKVLGKWHNTLVASSGRLVSLYGVVRQSSLDCPIAVSVRKLFVRFCSFTSTIFLTLDLDMQKYFLQLLSGIIQWISPPDAVFNAIECGESESEMIDGCRGLLAIATVTTPLVFDRHIQSLSSFDTITLLTSLMCKVLQVLMAKNTVEDTWSWVARDILLDTWTLLLVPMDNTGQCASLLSEGITAAAVKLFPLIVESELKASSALCEYQYQQASISAMDERLSSYALIARAAIDFTIPFLSSLFSERFVRLNQRGENDASETTEELYSLLLITGHVLTKKHVLKGQETLVVPKSIQIHSMDILEVERHPIVILSRDILKFAGQSLDPMHREVFSPRLMKAVIWFISRWSRAYLTSFARGNAWINYIKEGSTGVLKTIVSISQMSLLACPGEKELQDLTCYDLLNGMVYSEDICKKIVILDHWRDLAKRFATEGTHQDNWHYLAKTCATEGTLFNLHGTHQRSLARTLTIAASGMSSEASMDEYLQDLLNPTTDLLGELSKNIDIKKNALQPGVLHLVSCLVERLRGAASAAKRHDCILKAIFLMGMSVRDPIQIFLEVYKNKSAVVYLLLKFVVDWVDGVEDQETASVMYFCMGFLEHYSFPNIEKISISQSNHLLTEEETEQYKHLRALVELLSLLCSKIMVDYSSVSQTNHSPVLFLGLRIVTPLITKDLLKYPKLCFDYFKSLSYMLEIGPKMVAELNAYEVDHILGTLDFGLIRHEDFGSTCLSCLKALASYHYKEVNSGEVGLGSQATSRFLRMLLRFLLFEDYSSDLIDPAADALLPLILCDHGLYQRLADELKEANPTFKSRFEHALTTLSNNLSATLDLANYHIFRQNLNVFLEVVRAFSWTK